MTGQTVAPGYDDEEATDPSIPRDRRLQSVLAQLRTELDDPDGDHRQALQTLQLLLDNAEDLFTDATMSRSLRMEAMRLIGELSDQTYRLYQETYGPEAMSLLESGVAGSQASLREVTRRYFQTRAGADAAYRLAVGQMDGGHLLEAARLLDRLRTSHRNAGVLEPELSLRCLLCYWRSGETMRAAQILREASQNPTGIQIAGKSPDRLESTTAAFDWLSEHVGPPSNSTNVASSQWSLPQGGAGRNATVSPVAPLFDDAWRVPLIRDRDAEDPVLVEELATTLEGVTLAGHDAGWPAIPVLSPLAVGDVVVFPSYGLVKAVDRQTGTLRWVALPADHTFADAMTTTNGVGSRQVPSEMNDLLAQRAWLDATSSQISADNERVYVLRDSGMVGGLSPQYAVRAQIDHPRRPRNFNALRAYDAAGGSWKWEVGGARTRAALPLAGTFFLGAPLAVDGTLYVLGEDLGQIRLHALDPESGAVQWSLALANSDTDIEDELDRRLAGLSPTLAGGLIVCPTGSGLIVAVDPLSRTLEWGVRYRESQPANSPNIFRRRGILGMQVSPSQQASISELMHQPRWHDACIVAAGSSLLVATPDVADPDDERRLVCLNLLDGSTRWQRGRGDTVYVGGVFEDTVLLIGKRRVDGVSLQNGHTSWSIPITSPCGRGVRNNGLYHLPLEIGEIVTIDIAQGKLLARSPVRSGEQLGNLIAVDGRLISQSATEVCSFRPREQVAEQIAHDLESDPDNPAALAVRGELRLHSGEIEAGLADLRQAIDSSEDPRPRDLLVATLLEGLRSDFEAFRPHIDELNQLATQPQLRSQFLMTYAHGLTNAGEPVLAFEQLLRLLEISDTDSPMEYTNDGRQVRRDRRVQGQLAQLYANADTDVRKQLDELTDNVLASEPANHKRATRAKLAAAIPRLRVEPSTDVDPKALLEAGVLASRVESQLLEARRLAPSSQQGVIAARLVEFYARHGRAESIAQLLGELQTVWADEPCLGDMTGSEWSAMTREADEISALLKSNLSWPTNVIDVQEHASRTNPLAPMRQEGPADPLAAFMFLPDGQRQISVRDGFGRQIPDGVLTMFPDGASSFQTQYFMQRGHRALIYQGRQFKLVDLLNGAPRVILEDFLVGQQEPISPGFRGNPGGQHRQQGFRGVVLWSVDPSENGSVGPLNDSVFCYLREHTLHAHDPFTGKKLWSIDEVPHGSEIFADDDFVLLVPMGQNVAHVYRALDGKKLGVRTLPSDVVRQRHGADWGRHFLRLERGNDRIQLAMYDPVSERDLWQRTIAPPFTWSPRDGYELCTLDQRGELVVLDPLSGDVLQETQVDVPDGLMAMSVLSLPDQWLVTTYRRPRADAKAQLAPIPTSPSVSAVNGPVTAFDRRTTDVMWSRVIANQQFIATLPQRWPILPLSAVVQATTQINERRIIPVLTRRIELIDRRTGETRHTSEANGNNRSLGLFWNISDVPPQLQLRLGSLELDISFLKEASRDLTGDGDLPQEPLPPGNKPAIVPPAEPRPSELIGEEN